MGSVIPVAISGHPESRGVVKKKRIETYRRIFSAVFALPIFAQSSTTIQLDEEFVVILARAVDVHAFRIVRIT